MTNERFKSLNSDAHRFLVLMMCFISMKRGKRGMLTPRAEGII
jgi:hypothetical protein